MSELKIIEQNGQLLVDSRDVAEMIGKEHPHLLRDIRGYVKVMEDNPILDSHQFFTEGSYINAQNKKQPCFQLTKKGCDMVANKLTGEKGILFTAIYVTRFEEMEKKIQYPVLTEEQQVREHLKLSFMTSERVDQVESKVNEVVGKIELLENSMRIDGSQEFVLRSQGQAKVMEVLGGINSSAYKQVGRKAFAELWRSFKKHFRLPRYSELPKSQFDEGVYFISKWRPSTSLDIEIEQCNRQTQLKLVKAE